MSSEPTKPEPFRIPPNQLTIDYLKMLLSRPPGEPICPFAERLLKSDPTVSQLSRWLYRKFRKKLDLDTLDHVCELVSERMSPLSDDVDGRLISDVLMVLKETEPEADAIDAPTPTSGSKNPTEADRPICPLCGSPDRDNAACPMCQNEIIRRSPLIGPIAKGLYKPPPSGRKTPERERPAAEPPVILGKQHEEPVVMGKRKPKLTFSRYNIVQALLNAGENGLNGDELVEKSGHSGAVNTLKTLARKDSDWGRVIPLPGKPGGRYRIVRPPDGH